MVEGMRVMGTIYHQDSPLPIGGQFLDHEGEPQIFFAQTITLLLSNTDYKMDGGGAFMFCLGNVY